MLTAVVLTGLVVVGVAAWQQYHLDAQEVRYQRLQEVVGELEKRSSEMDAMRSRTVRRELLHEEVTLQRVWPAMLLRVLALARPEGLGLDQVRETDTGLTISGRAREYEDVSQFLAELAKAPVVQKADVTSLGASDADGLLTFRLEVGISREARPYAPSRSARYVGSALGDPK